MAADSPVSTQTVRELVTALGSLAAAVDDHDRIERVRLFEELKAVASAAQAVETRDFEVSQRARQAIDGVPVKQQGRGVAAQIGLARRISPWAASRYLGWAKILPSELPQTFALLAAGRITEWRATLVARETLFLSRADRAAVDTELAPQLEGWGDRQVEAETKRAAYRLDPHGYLARVRGAEKDRRVTLRPAPDTMTRLTALLPVAQGVAAYAALGRAADTTTAGGDERGRGQLMADTLVERLTGQTCADAVPVEIELVMTEQTLLNNGDEPAELVGFGPLPAGLARELALGGHGEHGDHTRGDRGDQTAPRWLRRLFTHPTTGQLITMDSKRRFFTANQRRFIRYRDHGTCRTPWCNAPIRHTDHITPAAHGGPTHTDNSQGLCAACNHARQAPRWRAGTTSNGDIHLETPTGHRYRSRAPDPPRSHSRKTLDIRVAVADLIYLHGRRAA